MIKLQMGETFTEFAERWIADKKLAHEDSDYGGMLADSVRKLVATHSGEGHSGMSALMARAHFNWLCDAYESKHTVIFSLPDYEKLKPAIDEVIQ